MRIVMLLLALAVIGVIVVKQLNIKPSEQAVQRDTASSAGTPKVPVRPQDLKGFEQDMNRFVEDAGRRQAKEIDEAVK